MTPGAANSKLNLVILHAHDMGRYNAAYGHALPTSNIAALADDSFVFRDAHRAAPTCSPIRAAMLTGRTAHEVGMLGLAHRGWYLDNNDLHLAADQASSANLTEMRKRLDAWMEKTDDPIRCGPIPTAPGAKVDAREANHPGEKPVEKK